MAGDWEGQPESRPGGGAATGLGLLGSKVSGSDCVLDFWKETSRLNMTMFAKLFTYLYKVAIVPFCVTHPGTTVTR